MKGLQFGRRSEAPIGLIEDEAADERGQDNPVLQDTRIRYRRGSRVDALDAPVGTLRQVVVNESSAEIQAIVVTLLDSGEAVLMPPDLVDRNVGDDMALNVTREQFLVGARRAPRYDARMFGAVDLRRLARMLPMMMRGDARRSLVRVERREVETGSETENDVLI